MEYVIVREHIDDIGPLTQTCSRQHEIQGFPGWQKASMRLPLLPSELGKSSIVVGILYMENI